MNDPQLEYYYKHPTKYAETASKIDVLMRIQNKPCRGGTDEDGERMPDECDEGCPCARHDRMFDIMERWFRRYRHD